MCIHFWSNFCIVNARVKLSVKSTPAHPNDFLMSLRSGLRGANSSVKIILHAPSQPFGRCEIYDIRTALQLKGIIFICL